MRPRRGVPGEMLRSAGTIGSVVIRGKNSRKAKFQIGIHVRSESGPRT